MIAKISTGNYTLGMVKYNHDKTKEENINGKNATLLGVNNIINDDFKCIVETISKHNNLNPGISKPNIHISLNFHKDDVLDNNKIYTIANDYMFRMGYSNQPFAVYRHFDKEHPHVHIVSSQINESGIKINDSFLYRKSQRVSRGLELNYGITIATKQEGNRVENKSTQTLINEHLELKKHSLSGVLSRILLDALATKPCNEKELDYALLQYQTKRSLYEEEGNIKGNYFHLLSYDILNDPVIKDKGIKGSDIDLSFSYEALKMQLEINEQTKQKNLKNIMGRTYSLINKISADNKVLLSTLKGDLSKKGITLDVKRKQTGEDINTIYGLKFLDIKTGINYSASDLKIKTKDFLEKIIDNEKDKININIKDNYPANDKNNSKSQPNDVINQDSIYGSSNLLQSLFGFSPGESQEEQVSLAERKKRKRKRG